MEASTRAQPLVTPLTDTVHLAAAQTTTQLTCVLLGQSGDVSLVEHVPLMLKPVPQQLHQQDGGRQQQQQLRSSPEHRHDGGGSERGTGATRANTTARGSVYARRFKAGVGAKRATGGSQHAIDPGGVARILPGQQAGCLANRRVIRASTAQWAGIT